MQAIDVLIVTALQEEHDAARDNVPAEYLRDGVEARWKEKDGTTATPYLVTELIDVDGRDMIIALARPTRMGGPTTSSIASTLAERLKPRCLAMSGVCAGKPSDVLLGDVIIAEMVYAYDEGKRTRNAFEGDHRQFPMLDSWVRAAQELVPDGLPSFSAASEMDAKHWLLERLYVGENPKVHLARSRYFPSKTWPRFISRFQKEGLVHRVGVQLKLTDKGKSVVERMLFKETDGPRRLPFKIKIGPIASGNAVVKDGVTFDRLKEWGVRSILGIEMEAATIGTVAHRLEVPGWIVAKGVMDYADARKDDRYKSFAARASAEVLYRFLAQVLKSQAPKKLTAWAKSVYVVGGVTGETEYPDHEMAELGDLCRQLGQAIAQSGAELIVCSPFPDSADMYTVMGYVRSGIGGTIHFHSPDHPEVKQKRTQLEKMLGPSATKFIDWYYPGPETNDAWGQAWLLSQLQALERADLVVAIGGRLSKTANTLLHLAENRKIPLLPFAFLGGVARRAFQRRNWDRSYPGLDYKLLDNKNSISSVMDIANRLVISRFHQSGTGEQPPKTLFISRAKPDAKYANSLATYLKDAGYLPLFGDEEVSNERMVQPTITDALLKADVAVILWSRSYATSTWCNDELEFALERLQASRLQIWIFNLDGSDVVPRGARGLPQLVTRTSAELVKAVRELLEQNT